MLTPNPRLLAVAIAVSAGLVVSARQQATVRITSPVDDAYVSGLMRLTAVIEPPAATRNVKEVTFFADAKKVCTVSRQPFQCDWDAGDRVVEHTIRVTAEMIKGERAAATVHTRGVKFAEAVDVDVVQLTVVVTDGGRFVSGLKAEDFKVYDNDRPQAITSFESENISLEMVAALDVSSSMRDALPRVKESAKRFLGGLRPGDHVTLLAFNDIVYTLTQRTRDQAARALAIDRMRAWGGTALYDVVVDALRRLERQTGRRSLLLFSDGDDQSSHATLEAAMAHAESSDATIYAIGQGRAVTHARSAGRAASIRGSQRRTELLHRGRRAARQVLRGDSRGPEQSVHDFLFVSGCGTRRTVAQGPPRGRGRQV